MWLKALVTEWKWISSFQQLFPWSKNNFHSQDPSCNKAELFILPSVLVEQPLQGFTLLLWFLLVLICSARTFSSVTFSGRCRMLFLSVNCTDACPTGVIYGEFVMSSLMLKNDANCSMTLQQNSFSFCFLLGDKKLPLFVRCVSRNDGVSVCSVLLMD